MYLVGRIDQLTVVAQSWLISGDRSGHRSSGLRITINSVFAIVLFMCFFFFFLFNQQT